MNTREVLELYRSECERLGVENPMVLPPGRGEMVWISEDPDRTWQEIGPHLLHDATVYASWQRPGFHSAVVSEATTLEGLREEGKYRVLTPEDAIEYGRAQGPMPVFIHFPLCGGCPPELGWRSLELYAEKVLPAFR